MNDCITKPLSATELFRKIAIHVKNLSPQKSESIAFNPVEILKFFDNNQQLVTALAQRFESSWSKLEEQLKQALAQKNNEKINYIAHTCKGMSSYFSKTVSESALDLEKAARTTNWKSISLKVESFCQLMNQLQLLLSKHFFEQSPAAQIGASNPRSS
jgi:HPt (histidine-containing phosphotransfer) domain-containing protein